MSQSTALKIIPPAIQGQYCNFRGEDAEYFNNGGKKIIIAYADGSTEQLSIQKFNEYFQQGFLKLKKTLERQEVPVGLNDKTAEKIAYWKPYLEALARQPKPGSLKTRKEVIRKVANQALDNNPPSPSTLYNKYKAYEKSEFGVSSIFFRDMGASRGPYYPDEIQELANEIFTDYYLKPNGKNINQCYRELFRLFNLRFGKRIQDPNDGLYGYSCPSKATFYLWEKQLPYLDVIGSREGTRAAQKEKRRCKRKFQLGGILERVEMDAVHLNIGLVDENGEYIGKPLVYVAIDCYSRAILGYYIQIGGAESTDGVIKCILNALGSKDNLSVETQNAYIMYGLMSELVGDPSSAFISTRNYAFSDVLGYLLSTTPSSSPWKKPFIERWFLTLRQQLMCVLPGYVGKRTDQKQLEFDMKRQAELTFSQFEDAFVRYVVDEYHQTPHCGLNLRTPHDVWAEDMINNPPFEINNLESLRNFKGERASRKLDRGGVKINNLEYYSDELLDAAFEANARLPIDVEVYYNTEDVGTITVRFLDGKEFHVPTKEKQEFYSGLSLHQLREMKEETKLRDNLTSSNKVTSLKPVTTQVSDIHNSPSNQPKRSVLPPVNPEAVKSEANMIRSFRNDPSILSGREEKDITTYSSVDEPCFLDDEPVIKNRGEL